MRCISRLLRDKQAAGAIAMDVKESTHESYAAWIATAREKYSWGASSCNSYYRTPTGHTPFLFPGDYPTFVEQREKASLADFDLTTAP